MKTNKTLYIAGIVSILFHFLLMQLLSYESTPVKQEKKQEKKQEEQKKKTSVMDVALLEPDNPNQQKPKDATTIASKNQKVEKEPEKKVLRPKKEKKEPVQKTVHKPIQKAVEKDVKPQKKERVSQQKKQKKVEEVITVPKKEAKKSMYKPLSEMNLDPSSAAIQQITQAQPREHRLKSMLSSEADIPINTREEKYAPYAHALVLALEEQWQPGKDDYQAYDERARTVLLRITINRKGQLEHVTILRASPIEHLNQSALKALRDAAPYRPLPLSWGFDRVSFRLSFEVIQDRATFRTF